MKSASIFVLFHVTVFGVFGQIRYNSNNNGGNSGGNSPLLVEILRPSQSQLQEQRERESQNDFGGLFDDYNNDYADYGTGQQDCRTDYQTVTDTVYEEKFEKVCTDTTR